MNIEVVEKPSHTGRSNPHWIKAIEAFDALRNGQSLRITGLTLKEIGALRQQAHREVKARSYTREEQGELVLYMYKR